jgi:hypothetical protein
MIEIARVLLKFAIRSHCHSEVAAATEESLFGLDQKTERFLGTQRTSE